MPGPLAIPLIMAGTQLAGAGINAASQGNMNKKNRKFARESWNLQNEYNHPSSQMARLREAGLNPNLVYGNGADNTAQAMQQPRTEAPRVDLDAGPVLSAYYDTKMKQAQIDNLRVQNTVLEQEKILKEAQTVSTLNQSTQTAASTERTKFDLALDTELRETSAEMRRETLRKIQADRQFTLNQDDRAAAQNSSSLKEALERIITMRAERGLIPGRRSELEQRIENIRKDNRLKQLDIELREKGINPHDNMFFRVAARLLQKYLGSDDNKPPREYPYLSGDNTDSFGRPRK